MGGVLTRLLRQHERDGERDREARHRQQRQPSARAGADLPVVEGSQDDVAQRREDHATFFRDRPHDEFPVLASMAAARAAGGPDERFEFGMVVLIAGVDALAPRG